MDGKQPPSLGVHMNINNKETTAKNIEVTHSTKKQKFHKDWLTTISHTQHTYRT